MDTTSRDDLRDLLSTGLDLCALAARTFAAGLTALEDSVHPSKAGNLRLGPARADGIAADLGLTPAA